MILSRLGIASQDTSDAPPESRRASATPRTSGESEGIVHGETIKDFLKRKLPKTESERLICIAYYLTHASNTSEFSTKDINTLNGEAHQSAFANASVTIGNAVRHSKFLCAGSDGKKKITTTGEALVEALPDREKVSEALKAIRPRSAKSKKKSKRSKS